MSQIFDDNLVCPLTGNSLFLTEEKLTSQNGGPSYSIESGIARLNPDVKTDEENTPSAFSATTSQVRNFYSEAPFPNYNDFDTLEVFVQKAERSIFAKLLSQQIKPNTTFLEVGCGTGQLSNFIAGTTMARVYAADLTFASLQLGADFARRQSINGIKFVEMNLFKPSIKKASMDMVISNGVLHHTPDARGAFGSIAELVKPGGHILVGLYNKIGRLRTDGRRILYKLFGERALFLDPHLRQGHSKDKRRAWIQDQYCHPQETKHTMSEVLTWFEEEGFCFVSAIPKISGTFSVDENIFKPQSPGTALDRTMTEVEMLFSHYGGEGGLFIMVGQKI